MWEQENTSCLGTTHVCVNHYLYYIKFFPSSFSIEIQVFISKTSTDHCTCIYVDLCWKSYHQCHNEWFAGAYLLDEPIFSTRLISSWLDLQRKFPCTEKCFYCLLSFCCFFFYLTSIFVIQCFNSKLWVNIGFRHDFSEKSAKFSGWQLINRNPPGQLNIYERKPGIFPHLVRTFASNYSTQASEQRRNEVWIELLNHNINLPFFIFTAMFWFSCFLNLF